MITTLDESHNVDIPGRRRGQHYSFVSGSLMYSVIQLCNAIHALSKQISFAWLVNLWIVLA